MEYTKIIIIYTSLSSLLLFCGTEIEVETEEHNEFLSCRLFHNLLYQWAHSFQNDKSNTSGIWIILFPRGGYWVYDDWLWPWKYNYFHGTENAIYSFQYLGQLEEFHIDLQKSWWGTCNSKCKREHCRTMESILKWCFANGLEWTF